MKWKTRKPRRLIRQRGSLTLAQSKQTVRWACPDERERSNGGRYNFRLRSPPRPTNVPRLRGAGREAMPVRIQRQKGRGIVRGSSVQGSHFQFRWRSNVSVSPYIREKTGRYMVSISRGWSWGIPVPTIPSAFQCNTGNETGPVRPGPTSGNETGVAESSTAHGDILPRPGAGS